MNTLTESINLLRNPSAITDLTNWITTGIVTIYAAGTDDSKCFCMNANASMSQTIEAISVTPETLQLQIDTYSTEILTPAKALVKVTALFSDGSNPDVSWIPLGQLTARTIITDNGWSWLRTNAVIHIRDTVNMDTITMQIITHGITSPLYCDNLKLSTLTEAYLIEDQPYYGITIGKAKGIEIEKSDGSGKLILNSDTIEMTDEAGLPILKLDGVTRKLLISAVVQMLEGSVIDWNAINPPTAEDVGAKDINWNPDINDISSLEGYLTHISATGLYSPTIMAQLLAGATIEGLLIKAGKIIGLNDAAVLEMGEHGGKIDTAYDTSAATGQQASIRLKPGGPTGGGYIQALEDGGVYFYKNDNTGVPYGWIHPDGITNLIPEGGSGGSQATDTVIVHSPADAGVVITKDGNAETWTWTKDGGGRIIAMSSDLGRTISVSY